MYDISCFEVKQHRGMISGKGKMEKKIKKLLMAAVLSVAVVMNAYGNVSVVKAEGAVQEASVDQGSSSVALTFGISAVGLVLAGVLAGIDVSRKDDK